ncbi:unnamed protein product [Amoebophrya sp. A120]|nr:unnamed protein product [Amoebophrya sp. A120]|eukprot:GSA120T00009333001.1
MFLRVVVASVAPGVFAFPGGQNEARNRPDQLGCEFIAYPRDPHWHWKERNFASRTANWQTLTPHELNLSNLAPQQRRNRQSAESNRNEALARRNRESWNGPGQVFRFAPEYKLAQNLVDVMVRRWRYPVREIGIAVAGNHGRPLGAVASMGWDNNNPWAKFRLNLRNIHARHGTQEESVVSNWLVHAAGGIPRDLGRGSFATRYNYYARKMIELYKSTIQGKWGLYTNKSRPHDNRTRQGVNYRHTRNPVDFSDCWVVRNTKIGREDNKWYTNLRNPHTIGGLFWVAAPNAGYLGGYGGSGRRTLNTLATQSMAFFLAGLEAAVTAVIDAAIQEQLVYGRPTKILIFNKLGGGLYWPKKWLPNGPKRSPLPSRDVYRPIFHRALAAPVRLPGGEVLKKRHFFKDIVLAGL